MHLTVYPIKTTQTSQKVRNLITVLPRVRQSHIVQLQLKNGKGLVDEIVLLHLDDQPS